jgi:hypothetical protein
VQLHDDMGAAVRLCQPDVQAVFTPELPESPRRPAHGRRIHPDLQNSSGLAEHSHAWGYAARSLPEALSKNRTCARARS